MGIIQDLLVLIRKTGCFSVAEGYLHMGKGKVGLGSWLLEENAGVLFGSSSCPNIFWVDSLNLPLDIFILREKAC